MGSEYGLVYGTYACVQDSPLLLFLVSTRPTAARDLVRQCASSVRTVSGQNSPDGWARLQHHVPASPEVGILHDSRSTVRSRG